MSPASYRAAPPRVGKGQGYVTRTPDPNRGAVLGYQTAPVARRFAA